MSLFRCTSTEFMGVLCEAANNLRISSLVMTDLCSDQHIMSHLRDLPEKLLADL